MASRPVLAAWLVLAQVGIAAAGVKTSKVTIETDPPGAKVYFGLKEDGEICTTPCTIDVPIGETAIIIEAENRRSIIENLVVRRTRPMKVQYKLEPAIGTLIVEGGDGATIKLDDEDHGTAPRRIENVLAGGHHVALERDGVQIFDDFIDVEAGQEVTVAVPARAVAAPPGPDEPAISASAGESTRRPSRQTPMVAVSAAMSVGFRQFTYSNNRTRETQHDSRERGQVLTGVILDLWPTTLLGVRMLPGLALHARFEYGVTPQEVRYELSQDATSLTTAWQSLEVSLNQRWTIAGAGTIQVGAGYVDDRYRFNGMPEDVASVPDATYQAIRIGGRASLLVRSFEPYAAFENRIVLHGGAMEKRYTLGTSVLGVRGVLGAALHLGRLAVRVEGAVTYYSWAFRPDSSDPMQADGGKDVIENVMLAVGYSY
jgi:PEGA domain